MGCQSSEESGLDWSVQVAVEILSWCHLIIPSSPLAGNLALDREMEEISDRFTPWRAALAWWVPLAEEGWSLSSLWQLWACWFWSPSYGLPAAKLSLYISAQSVWPSIKRTCLLLMEIVFLSDMEGVFQTLLVFQCVIWSKTGCPAALRLIAPE